MGSINSTMRRSNPVDQIFMHHLNSIVKVGSEVQTRNATTKRLLNSMVTFTQTPLVTVRRTAWKNALREFEWFLSGSNNINDLDKKVHSWWKPWADNDGFIPNNYSRQLRNFFGISNSVDQVEYMIDTLTNDPGSRRNVITTWNTADMLDANTPITNCHGTVIQAFVEPSNDSVHLTMYQRSCDMVLGVPHNWIQYWALMLYLSHRSGRKPGTFTWIGGDCHVYPNHEPDVKEMANKLNPKKGTYEIPNLIYKPTSKKFKADDFSLDIKYKPLYLKSLKMTV